MVNLLIWMLSIIIGGAIFFYIATYLYDRFVTWPDYQRFTQRTEIDLLPKELPKKEDYITCINDLYD